MQQAPVGPPPFLRPEYPEVQAHDLDKVVVAALLVVITLVVVALVVVVALLVVTLVVEALVVVVILIVVVLAVHVARTPLMPHFPSLLQVSLQSSLLVQQAPVGPFPFLRPEYPEVQAHEFAVPVVVALAVVLVVDWVVVVVVAEGTAFGANPSLLLSAS